VGILSPNFQTNRTLAKAGQRETMAILRLAVTTVLISLAACNGSNNEEKLVPGIPQYKAAQIGDQYVATHFPEYNRKKYPLIVQEKRCCWIVRYKLPKDMLGGTTAVSIDKSTYSVVYAYLGQ
jgi:hypothetical protein